MPENAFELMVMFFRLINLLAIFQTMMNNLLRDMIEVGDVAAFINDVIIGIETEEGHNNIVEKVLRRIAENNFFYKTRKMCIKG